MTVCEEGAREGGSVGSDGVRAARGKREDSRGDRVGDVDQSEETTPRRDEERRRQPCW